MSPGVEIALIIATIVFYGGGLLLMGAFVVGLCLLPFAIIGALLGR
jgi:hypothetical protein